MIHRTAAKYTERIILFGTGKFVRAFVAWQIDLLNAHTDLDAGIVIIKSTASPTPS